MATVFNSLLSTCPLKQAVQKLSLSRTFHFSSLKMAKVGDTIPSVVVYEGNPGNAINVAEFCKDKKVILFGVPGAFTPGCSRTHLPGYIDRYYEFKKKGIDEIVCVAVNDVFVMDAWGKYQDAYGKVRMFADPDATFTKALGLDVTLTKLGGIRSKRYVMLIKKGVIALLNIEPDSVGLSCSLAMNLRV